MRVPSTERAPVAKFAGAPDASTMAASSISRLVACVSERLRSAPPMWTTRVVNSRNKVACAWANRATDERPDEQTSTRPHGGAMPYNSSSTDCTGSMHFTCFLDTKSSEMSSLPTGEFDAALFTSSARGWLRPQSCLACNAVRPRLELLRSRGEETALRMSAAWEWSTPCTLGETRGEVVEATALS
eukprot:scaffold280950_cov30-Tisochrysis_lutea.AAC.3